VDDAALTLVILGVVIVLFVWNRLSVGVVAILTMLALWTTGLLSTEAVLAGFGDPVVVFIATLFVVSEGIDSTGVTTWLGQLIVAKAGESRARLVLAVGLLCAVLTALITLNGSVAALLPLVVVLAMRIGQPPSQMLMPLAFAGSCGALFMLTGSPVNVIVSEAAQDSGAPPFAFLSFAIVGVPLLAGTLAICVLLGPRLLPHRRPAHQDADLGRHAETLEQYYSLTDGFFRLRLRDLSPLVGQVPEEAGLSAYPEVVLVGVQDPERRSVTERALAVDDVLVVSGPRHEVSRMTIDLALAVAMDGSADAGALLTREAGAVEVVVPPRSSLVGEKVYPGMKRAYDLVILAVQRMGKDRPREQTELVAGDALLLQGSWAALDSLSHDRTVLVVDSPDVIRRQAVPWGPKATVAVAIVAGMVVLLAFGIVPPAIAGLLAATAMVVTRVVSVPQAYRSISWQTVVLIGGLIPLTTAIRTSGAADRIATVITAAVGEGRPYVLMVAMFLLTAVLGQIVSNTATVLIVTPIAVSAAAATHTSVQPVLMLIAVAGSAARLTPIATPANLMVMSPGGYRFGDYWRLGLPVMLWWLAVSLVVIPLVWRF
jgi:di/tricarboxylate transporter